MSLKVAMIITCDAPGCDSVHEGMVELEDLRLWLEYNGNRPLLPSPPPGWWPRGTRGCSCPKHGPSLALPGGRDD